MVGPPPKLCRGDQGQLGLRTATLPQPCFAARPAARPPALRPGQERGFMSGLSAERQATPGALWPQVRRLRGGQAARPQAPGFRLGARQVLATRPEERREATHAGLVRPRSPRLWGWSEDLTQGLVSSETVPASPPRAGGAHTGPVQRGGPASLPRAGVHTGGPIERGETCSPSPQELGRCTHRAVQRAVPASQPRGWGATHRGPSGLEAMAHREGLGGQQAGVQPTGCGGAMSLSPTGQTR